MAPSFASFRAATHVSQCDAIVIGAGPAGTTAAILLALAGWSVMLIEKNVFPRRKVCGECVAASNLPLLDALGVGTAFAALAGPELRQVGLFSDTRELSAPLPAMAETRHLWGRALDREHLDPLLLARAIELGVDVRQPWAVKRVTGTVDGPLCEAMHTKTGQLMYLSAPVIVRAHGSWEPEPADANAVKPVPKSNSDLLAFKATFRNSALLSGLLPILAFPGGYGGMVLADHEQLTFAFCIRRDMLGKVRRAHPGLTAAQAARAHIEMHCANVRRALVDAHQIAPWLAVGPLRPGMGAPWRSDRTFAIGNAAGEAHPILGEGMSMAFQSAWMLCEGLVSHGTRGKPPPASALDAIGRHYAKRWRRSFAFRIRFAACCAQLAMRPAATNVLLPILQRWPNLLTRGARAGSKVRSVVNPEVISRMISEFPAQF